MTKLTPTIEEIEALRKTTPPGPVVIVNLLKFKPEGGREAYARYMSEASRSSYPGVEIIYAGPPSRMWAAARTGTSSSSRATRISSISPKPSRRRLTRWMPTHTAPAALEKTIMMVTQPASLQEYFKRG
jgi:hypothetical protein